MKFTNQIFLLLVVLISASPSYAGTWSACVKITALSEYPWGFYITVPEMSACKALAVPGVLQVQAGQGPAGYVPTPESIKSYRATALLARSLNQKVMFYYDETSAVCSIGAVSLGGYSGQCN